MRSNDSSETMDENVDYELIARARYFAADIYWCPREFRAPGRKKKRKRKKRTRHCCENL
jgi:hypothetical protein